MKSVALAAPRPSGLDETGSVIRSGRLNQSNGLSEHLMPDGRLTTPKPTFLIDPRYGTNAPTTVVE
jgi:hypothetical protein